MYNRILKILFCALFFLLLIVPLILVNKEDNVVSEAENRYLAPKAKLYSDNGEINKQFPTDFENWINDNIGFRSEMVIGNANIQYHMFGVLSNNSDMYLGPNGELNYATETMLTDYQHNNLYDEEYLNRYAKSMQIISDYIEAQGRRFFYFQCWDKHSIYPEQFPTSVIQHGNISKTDQLVEVLENTTVKVVSPKKELMDAKDCYDTYSRWGDPSHWSYRGSLIAYNVLIKTMNEKLGTNYRPIEDQNLEIVITDQGSNVFGGIHEEDYQEIFGYKNSAITDCRDRLTLYSDDLRCTYLTNPMAENQETVLLIADSYFAGYCIWDFAYTFQNVIFIHADHAEDMIRILDTYPSDYVILERAERADSSQAFINTAYRIYGTQHPIMSISPDALYADEEQIYDDRIIIHPGHIQYGPYSPLEKGQYRIVVHGNAFSELSESCIYINPNAWFGSNPENVNITDDMIQYEITLFDDVYQLELGIVNKTEDRIIEIQQIEVYNAR